MNRIGFSTGAVALADFAGALATLDHFGLAAVELSALRLNELPALAAAASDLDLDQYSYISVHAPTNFSDIEERSVTDLLFAFAPEWPIVAHPDTIVDWSLWERFEDRLLIENMDKRRALGKRVHELNEVFSRLPGARLCFDIAHARQVDTSMLEAFLILDRFSDRLAQVHVSELDASSRHRRLTEGGVSALREVSSLIPPDIPIIIEAPVQPSEIEAEIAASLEALGRAAPLRSAA